MTKTIPISKDKYYKAALTIANVFLGLTNFELDVIVTMLNNNVKSLTKDTRVVVRELMNKDMYTFNNYVKRLKDKKALIEVNDELVINPNITDAIADREFNISFNVYNT